MFPLRTMSERVLLFDSSFSEALREFAIIVPRHAIPTTSCPNIGLCSHIIVSSANSCCLLDEPRGFLFECNLSSDKPSSCHINPTDDIGVTAVGQDNM
jgi:hypothetical protein